MRPDALYALCTASDMSGSVMHVVNNSRLDAVNQEICAYPKIYGIIGKK